jgi:carbon-monoxide dehydrogenase medium subunit
MFETALSQGEIVSAIVVPAGPKGGRAIYHKLSLVAGDFAIVSVAAIVDETARVAVGSCGPKPLFASGLPLDARTLREVALKLAAACDPPSDHRGSAAYRRKVLPELVCRAVRAATP